MGFCACVCRFCVISLLSLLCWKKVLFEKYRYHIPAFRRERERWSSSQRVRSPLVAKGRACRQAIAQAAAEGVMR